MFSMNRKDIPEHLLKYFEPKRVYKQKDDLMMPHRVYDALMTDGWYGRQDICWSKPNPIPESVKDRCTKAHEYIFLLTKNARYWYDNEAIKEDSVDPEGTENRYKSNFNSFGGGLETGMVSRNNPTASLEYNGKRNKRSVWTITTKPYPGSHYAVFPPDLIEPCILAGCPEGGLVLDPFVGSGTTCMVARKHNRDAIGIDLSYEYLTKNARERLQYGSYVPVADGINQFTIGF